MVGCEGIERVESSSLNGGPHKPDAAKAGGDSSLVPLKGNMRIVGKSNFGHEKHALRCGSSRRPPLRLRTLRRRDVLFLDGMAGNGIPSPRSARSKCSSRTTQLGDSSARSLGSNSIGRVHTGPLERSPRVGTPGSQKLPSWAMCYCEYLGSVFDDVQAPRSALTVNRKMPTDSQPLVIEESVFLPRNGKRDKCVARLLEDNSKLRPSRLWSRRNAIGPSGQRLAVLATRIMTQKNPEYMRRLGKQLKQQGGGLIPSVETKALSAKKLDELSEKIGMSEQEIQTLFTAFNRYDLDDNGLLDRAELRQSLADLGMQPRTREEKVEVHEILCDHDLEGLSMYDFDSYLSLVNTLRFRLRQIQSSEFREAFEEADVDGSNTMDYEEVMDILSRRMGLAPQTEDETHEVRNIFAHADADGDGQLNFEECQECVQRMRSKLMIMRREEAMMLAKAFQLRQDMLMEFVDDLPSFWEIFNQYDHGSRRFLSKVDLVALLMDTGVAPSAGECRRMMVVQHVLTIMATDDNDFLHMLRIVSEIRRQCKEVVMDDLTWKFKSYDRDRSDSLGMPEICQILEDFGMLPKTRDEQQSIAQVIERFDVDGSGAFDIMEFREFFQRLIEQVQQCERKRENMAVCGVGFSMAQVATLRRTYLTLGPQRNGRVGQLDVALSLGALLKTDFFCATGLLLDEQQLKDFTRYAQRAPEQVLDFMEFAVTVRHLLKEEAIRPDIAEEDADGVAGEQREVQREVTFESPQDVSSAGLGKSRETLRGAFASLVSA
eukprot:TRINITY_DN55914_c0_g1_i1.p1 TRINITY_DN55914_c0_g1~~TRINITY_DN55914_c0_g1_i1.p1  ORF type:complete len:791 (+),score=150.38 TRINITY_DN55914_c0_g1_i1:55-2373(+)